MKRRFRYGSVCSGIEAATTAWHPLGWKPVFFSEIEPFPCSVLAHHWPDVSNLGDMTKHKDWNHALEIDLLVGGTPCQAFSIAGLRAGLADPRGNLTLTFLGLVDQFKPRWVVWENVPGVLSEKTGAFGLFLEGLAQLGYGWAYRILDAQYFGVAQRRRRVFVVAHIGADWRRAAAVLFEPDCLRGNPPPSREKGQGFAHDAASCIGASGRGFERGGDTRGQDPVVACPIISPPLKARDCKGPSSDGDGDGAPLIAHSLRGEGFDASEDGTGRGTPLVPVVANALRASASPNGHGNSHGLRGDGGDNLIPVAVAFPEIMPTMTCGGPSASSHNQVSGQMRDRYIVPTPTMRVRRLTPRECERLQGFPDDHTRIPWRKKPADDCPDGPRYKAIGNSMAVPVMAWIGRRIKAMENSL